MQRARQRGARALVLEDRKFPDSWPHFTPRDTRGKPGTGKPQHRKAYPVASNDGTIPSDPDVEIEVGTIGTGNVTETVAPAPFD